MSQMLNKGTKKKLPIEHTGGLHHTSTCSVAKQKFFSITDSFQTGLPTLTCYPSQALSIQQSF